MEFKKFLIFSMKNSIFVLIIAHRISCDFDSRHYTCAVNNDKCLQYRRRACCDTFSSCQKKNDSWICRKKAILGDTCTEDSDCILENSICINHYCQCSQDYFINGSKCLPKYLGGACEKNLDCFNILNAVCSNRQCACRSDYINTAKNKCSQTLRSFCIEPTFPCTIKNSRCIDNKCQCKADHISIDKYQCEPITLGRSCTFNSEFVSHKFKCSDDKIFVCNKNYTSINEGCVPVSNGVCSEDNQCRRGFQCVDNKCQCEPNYTLSSTHQCIQSTLVPSCIDTLDCSDPWHAQCFNKKCICTINHIAINNVTCYPILAGYCWIQRQCLTKNSECIDFLCQCKKNFFQLSDNLCEKKINFE